MRDPGLDRRIAEFCAERRSLHPSSPVILGINGPQGSGKSTLAALLVELLSARGLRAVAVSIDDFYLTRAQQLELAAAHPGNRALEHRGYPGTHDVALGVSTLDDLRAGRPTRLPRYDKSAHAGRGDRAPHDTWPMVKPGLDVVLFEGWMLGFQPVDETTLPPELHAPNRMLAAYGAWTQRLDATIALRAASADDIVRWRIDSERARRERGEPALSDADARDYIERFLPAYRAWAPTVVAQLNVTLLPDRTFASVHG